VDPLALVSFRRLAFIVLGIGLVVWLVLGVLLRKRPY